MKLLIGLRFSCKWLNGFIPIFRFPLLVFRYVCAVLVTSVFRILCRFRFPASDISSVYNTFFNNNSTFPEVVFLTFNYQDIAILAKIKVS